MNDVLPSSNTQLRWAMPSLNRQSQQEERTPQEVAKAYHDPAEKTLFGIGYELNLELVWNHSIIIIKGERTGKKKGTNNILRNWYKSSDLVA